MTYDIVKLRYSGVNRTIYSLVKNGATYSLLSAFLMKLKTEDPEAAYYLDKALGEIGRKKKSLNGKIKQFEGKPGDGVCALFYKEVRVCCIEYGNMILIIGGGGIKPKGVRSWQDVPELKREFELTEKISKLILEKTKDKLIQFDEALNELIGDLTINDDEDE